MVFKRKIKIIFSTKKDGTMRIGDKKGQKNIEKFLKKVGINKNNVVLIKGSHGQRIKKASKKDGGKIIRGFDGLITKEKEIFLGITFGDCLPVFLWNKEKRVISLFALWLARHFKRNCRRGNKENEKFWNKTKRYFCFHWSWNLQKAL